MIANLFNGCGCAKDNKDYMSLNKTDNFLCDFLIYIFYVAALYREKYI